MGDPSGALAEFAGPSTNLAISGWPMSDGARQSLHKSPTPEIAHFIPFDKDVIGIDPQTAINEIKQDLPQPAVAIHYSFIKSAATVEAFVKTLARPLSAIGFIGHSVDVQVGDTNQFYSVGLSFNLANEVLVLPPNPNPPFPVPQYQNSTTTAQIQTQAKIVFIGACFIGPTFQSIWNINGQTLGRAMVVPQSSQVILGHAVVAWGHLLDDLILQHMKVQDAVNETNKYLLTLPGVTEQWQVVGDGNVKIE
jgi:hypothetical protein